MMIHSNLVVFFVKQAQLRIPVKLDHRFRFKLDHYALKVQRFGWD